MTTTTAQQEMAKACALADWLDEFISRNRVHWGIASIALATTMASAIRRSCDSPATGRRVMNETYAYSRQLLADAYNESVGPDAKSAEMVRALVRSALAALQVDADRKLALIDRVTAAVAECTGIEIAEVAFNMQVDGIRQHANSLPDALAGVDALAQDMRNALAERYSDPLEAAPAQGTA